MKKIKIVVVIFLVSLSTNAQEGIKYNGTVKSVFNQSEIEDLERIMDFFKKNICFSKDSLKKNEVNCYKKFIDRAFYLAKKGENITITPLFNQKEFYNKLKKETFNEVWHYGYSKKPNSLDTLRVLDFNTKGKYAKYLKELGKNSKVIDHYYNSFIMSGAYSPSLFTFLLERKYYKIEDIRLRLVIAISYLTINDYAQRNEEY